MGHKRVLTTEAKLYIIWLLLIVSGMFLVATALWLSSELSRLENIIHNSVWFLVIASDFKGNSHLFLQERLLRTGEVFDAGNRYVVEYCQETPISDESIPFVVDTSRPLTDEEAEEIGRLPTSFGNLEIDLDWVDL